MSKFNGLCSAYGCSRRPTQNATHYLTRELAVHLTFCEQHIGQYWAAQGGRSWSPRRIERETEEMLAGEKGLGA